MNLERYLTLLYTQSPIIYDEEKPPDLTRLYIIDNRSIRYIHKFLITTFYDTSRMKLLPPDQNVKPSIFDLF